MRSREKVRERIRTLRSQLVRLLRKASIVVIAQASDNQLRIVCDKIVVSHEGNRTAVVVDGYDISDAISEVQVKFRPRDFPVIMMRYKQTALQLNAED